ncbi:hypothetical protein DVR14_21000 (plasmid) [Natrinema thermotolerans]|nr:hypothetical protein DVR14_21000 [Natrinema thermotolerans]
MSSQDTFGGSGSNGPEIDDTEPGFYNYVDEREQIRRRKEIANQNPPWTADEILQQYHFCNIDRRHDRGTRFYLEHVAPPSQTAFTDETEVAEDLFIRTVVYRLLNHPDSYREIEDLIDGRDTDLVAIVATLEDREERVFSSAYRVGGNNTTDYNGKLEQLFYGGLRDDLMPRFDELCEGTMYADTLEQANQPLRDVTGFGEFLVYEIATDLNYIWFDFHEDDFVNVGPGAEKGLEQIYGDDISDYEAKLRDLQSKQDESLPEDFPTSRPAMSNTRSVSTRSISV